MDDFSGLSEEDIAALLELGVIDDQQSMLSGQLAQANTIRNRPGPEGRQAGRVYTAANPLEFLGRGMEMHKAEKETADIKKQQEALLQQQIAGRKLYFDKLLREPQQAQYPEMQNPEFPY